MLKFISYFLAYLVLTEAWRALRSPRARIRWRKLRRSDFVLAVPLVLAVFGVGALLYRVAPALRWGWWSWLGGGNGTALQGATPTLTHTTPLLLFVVPVLMPLLLVIALPAMVHAEERGFRRGAENWSVGKRAAMPLAFGLAHLVMGIPFAFALAIGVAGAAFQWRYLQAHALTRSRYDALNAAVRAHMAYNTVLLSLWLFAAFALLALRLLEPTSL